MRGEGGGGGVKRLFKHRHACLCVCTVLNQTDLWWRNMVHNIILVHFTSGAITRESQTLVYCGASGKRENKINTVNSCDYQRDTST